MSTSRQTYGDFWRIQAQSSGSIHCEQVKVESPEFIHVNNPRFPQPRYAASFSYVEGLNSLVLFGGFAGDDQFLKDTWVHDLKDGKWSQIPEDEEGPPRRWGHSAVVYKDYLVVFGEFTTNDFHTLERRFSARTP